MINPGTALVTILTLDNYSYPSRSRHGSTKVAHTEAMLPSGIHLAKEPSIKVGVKSLPQITCLGGKVAVAGQIWLWC